MRLTRASRGEVVRGHASALQWFCRDELALNSAAKGRESNNYELYTLQSTHSSQILAAVRYALVDLPGSAGLVVYHVGRDRARSAAEVVGLALLERAPQQAEER